MINDASTRQVNLFICGAPRSGTTTLAELLGAHPDIHMGLVKEPMYFADTYKGREVTSLRSYNSLYEDAPTRKKWILDASTLYMYFPECARNIRDYNPNSRLICILRDPQQMVASWYWHMRTSRNGRECAQTFDEAWGAIQQRKRGKNLPSGCVDARLLFYDCIAQYHSQLLNILQQFPREQVQILFYDDIRARPSSVLEELADFLEVSSASFVDVTVSNARREARNSLAWFLASGAHVAPTKRFLRSINMGGALRPLRAALFRAQRPQELSPRMKMEIRTTYAEQVAAIARLTNRPINGWLRTA